MKRRHRDVNGLWMNWRESGEGLPVVMVHGLATSPMLWRNVMPKVSSARCLAWELVGYGNSMSQGARRNISVAQQAVYLLDWLRALRIRRAIFVGHGLGGGVLQVALKRKPAVCQGLVLVNSVGYDAWPTPAVNITRRFPRLVERLPKFLFRLAFRRLMRISHVTRAAADEAFALYWPYYAEDGPRAFVRQAKDLHLRDTRNVITALQQIAAPKCVIWGARDRILPVRYGFRFARDLDATLQYIFKGGHFSPEDHPQIVADAINDMVVQVQAGGDASQPEVVRRYG
ncbi:MAG: alpha/beta fold hydrolase [Gammaproteobacteria bacterium]|nr:alpha/beta fold hydrolase [Gammaproteobacteria bacterium]